MQLGFACVWGRPPETTWSHTPWQLRAALRERGAVVDYDLTVPVAVETGLKLSSARRRDGAWVSMWRHSRSARALTERALRDAVRRRPSDVVVQIGDLAVLPDTPYLLVQDLSFDVLLDQLEPGQAEVAHFPGLSRPALVRLRDRQRRVYAGAAGVIALSHWLAGELTERSGLDPTKVHTVHPGGSAVTPPDAASAQAGRRRRAGPRRRLLSIGKDFPTKGGAQVLAALALLRREHDPHITLTVAGPAQWPFRGAPPAGVDFRGRVPLAEVAALYDEHDLFVLPSRLEGFGIVFAEALARGLPCVGRRAFAMPEIIRPGVGGLLVEGSAPADLAEVILAALGDDALYAACTAAAAEVAAHYRWGRAADDVLAIARAVT